MWDRLETFYHIAKVGSFTKAEKVLNKSQSALSRSILLLEGQLGHKLFKRKHQGLELTRKGEEVFRFSQKILMEIDEMKVSLSESKSMKGKIRISTTHAIGNYILTDPLTEFAEKYPDIDLEFVCNDKRIDIFHNEVDIAIRPYTEDNDRIIQEPLISLNAALYASPSYLKKFGTPQNIKDLDKHRLLTRSRGYENPYSDVDWVLKVGRDGRENRKPFYTSNSTPNLLKAAEKGMGIVTFYEAMQKNRQSSLLRVLEDIERPTYVEYIIYPTNLTQVEKIKFFKTFLQDYYQKKTPQN